MRSRYRDHLQYFREQAYTSNLHLVPLIQTFQPEGANAILEIGVGRGGVIRPFLELGYQVTGIDINKNKLFQARKHLSKYIEINRLELVHGDILVSDFDKPF